MAHWMDEIANYDKPATKKLYKLGTVAVDTVEATPVVFGGRLYRFEWYRKFAGGGTDDANGGYYHFVDMETGTETKPFAHGYNFGSAYCEDGVMYVAATGGGWGSNILDMFISRDLENWEKRILLHMPENWKIFNTSLCKGKDGYVLAIEISEPKEYAGVPFTTVFARSDDLVSWEMLDPEKYVFTKERYSACPVIRYEGGYYYMIYLEGMPMYKFVPYIARSEDLLSWHIAPVNPIMFYDDDDRKLCGIFTDEEKRYINTSLDTNNSDIDLCEFNGKTHIIYSWGNQSGREFLARAEYDGSMREFFESFF